MFQQKKKSSKNKLFYVFLAVLVAFGYWLNAGFHSEDDIEKQNLAQQASRSQSTDGSTANLKTGNSKNERGGSVVADGSNESNETLSSGISENDLDEKLKNNQSEADSDKKPLQDSVGTDDKNNGYEDEMQREDSYSEGDDYEEQNRFGLNIGNQNNNSTGTNDVSDSEITDDSVDDDNKDADVNEADKGEDKTSSNSHLNTDAKNVNSGDNNSDNKISEDNAVSNNTGNVSYFATVKEDAIVIYLINEKGEKTLFLETEIVPEQLSSSDKELFTDGIKLNSETEVYELLQDFES